MSSLSYTRRSASARLVCRPVSCACRCEAAHQWGTEEVAAAAEEEKEVLRGQTSSHTTNDRRFGRVKQAVCSSEPPASHDEHMSADIVIGFNGMHLAVDMPGIVAAFVIFPFTNNWYVTCGNDDD